MADTRMGEVRLDCPETLAATLLPGVVEWFSEQYPGIRLHVVQTNPLALEVLACATDQQQKDERQKTRAV
jgi:DNA-binding transcriptional LysR family regulator